MKFYINQRYVPQRRTLETTSGITAELRGINPSACLAAGLKNLILLRHIDFSKKIASKAVFLELNNEAFKLLAKGLLTFRPLANEGSLLYFMRSCCLWCFL